MKLAVADGKVKVGNGYVVNNDVAADNGIIHAIDMVAMPK